MQDRHRVAVLGGGSFGTVIANIIASNGHQVRLWMRNAQRADQINRSHENTEYLPGFRLHENLTATSILDDSVDGIDILFVAVPSKSFREVVRQVAGHLSADTLVISLTKGIESPNFKLMSEILGDELAANPRGVLSGPNLAREIAAGHLTGSVIATASPEHNSTVQALLHSNSFRLYTSYDMYGVELGGALKNVYAIMTGMGAALALGENTIGMLLTRALAEMSRFAVHMGANPLTFLGLAGVGDLIVTCESQHSRNRGLGERIARGEALDDIQAGTHMVAEGVRTTRSADALAARLGIEMPITHQVYRLLFEQANPHEAIAALMARDAKPERD